MPGAGIAPPTREGTTVATSDPAPERDIEKILRALNSPIRREILALVWDQEVAAGQIADAFAVTKPTISQHLAVLREAGLVTTRVAGNSRRYRARHEALTGLHAALGHPEKWRLAEDVPERSLADTRDAAAVVVSVDVPVDQGTAFAAFTDAGLYSRWLGVPVTIEDGRFACTLEWGTNVRGRYEVVAPPELIAMSWDFDDETIPVPGNEVIGYLRIASHHGGARVVVHQLADNADEAAFMKVAWSTVLGRFRAGVVAATSPDRAVPRRPPRTKRRRSA